MIFPTRWLSPVPHSVSMRRCSLLPQHDPIRLRRRLYTGLLKGRRRGKRKKVVSPPYNLLMSLSELMSDRAASPSESFYVVHRDRPGPSSQVSIGTEDKVGGKTPEELALENENLRTSLDAIASHAEKLEQANKVLREQHDEREKAMRSIAVGMRREVRQYRQPVSQS